MLLGIYFEEEPSFPIETQPITWVLCGNLETEDEFHQFVTEELAKSFEGFVIYFELPKFEEIALRLIGHLRLSNSNVKPIYVLAKRSIEKISRNAYANVLNLAGVSYKDVSSDDAEIETKSTITIEELKTQLKKGLSIPKPKKEGNHAIANEWGAFKLAYATNTLHLLEKNENVQAKSKTLYFKYLCLKENIQFPSATLTPLTIDCQNKKVLLIDDQADKGWEDIFKAILQTPYFEISPISYQPNSKLKDEEKIYSDAQSKIETKDWDIVLLDLRLKSSDRENTASFNDIKQFSGYQLLQQIKAKNKGIQVIVFTASNKAWNMKHLVEAGADGYYIKESPDFQYEENYAQENFDAFKTDMERAVEKADFLKWFWDNTKKLKEWVDKEYKISMGEGFVKEVELSLDYAYDTIANFHFEIEQDEKGVDKIDANRKPILKYQKYLNYAFVGYCNLIEYILRKTIVQEEVTKNWIFSKANEVVIKYNPQKNVYELPIKHKSYPTRYIKEQDSTAEHNIIENRRNVYKLKDLLQFAILVNYFNLLEVRANSKNLNLSEEYEKLRQKRHSFMHNNKNQSDNITLPDCQDIFRMVYIVLKGIDLPLP